jgi:hypothetical protein
MNIITSRSRSEAFANCPRLGYLGYEWGGCGLESVQVELPLANGIAVHEILAQILGGTPPNEAISKALANYEADARSRGVANEDPEGLEALIQEQARMIEGTVWAWVETRLPRLAEEFEFTLIEKELTWPASRGCEGPEVLVQIRCDLLARQRASGGLYYVEFKTASSGGDEWVKQWEHNNQLLSNTLAIEETLHERCEGVIIEGILKGSRSVDKAQSSPFCGRRIQQSKVCYGWRHAGSGDYRTAWTAAKGWVKVASWEEMPARRWVTEVMSEEDRAGLFVSVPPIRPNPRQLERFRRQLVARERRIAVDLAFVRCGGATLDEAFPMHDGHCFRYWGHPCAFEPLCFREEIENDPLGSGWYQRRTAHHPKVEG